jgi:hypothetical protein
MNASITYWCKLLDEPPYGTDLDLQLRGAGSTPSC